MKERRRRLTALMPGKTVADRQKNFTVIFSAMAGAMAIARIMPDPAERCKALTSMRDHLLQSF
jgi:hypothetical protein